MKGVNTMKKIILTVVLVLGCLALVTPAFAVNITSPTGTSIGDAAYVPSTGVTIDLRSDANDYCATAQHAASDPNKGGKQYGATAGDSNIKGIAAVSSGPTACTATDALPSGF